jgi:hypothetical protein
MSAVEVKVNVGYVVAPSLSAVFSVLKDPVKALSQSVGLFS